MAQEVELLIRTQIKQSGMDEADVMELSLSATVYYKNNGCYIMYEEIDEESGEKTACRLHLLDDKMEITKKGQISSYMELVAGKDTATEYRTPYGTLRMDIHTDFLQISHMPEHFEVKAAYELSAQGEAISRNEMMLVATMQP